MSKKISSGTKNHKQTIKKSQNRLCRFRRLDIGSETLNNQFSIIANLDDSGPVIHYHECINNGRKLKNFGLGFCDTICSQYGAIQLAPSLLRYKVTLVCGDTTCPLFVAIQLAHSLWRYMALNCGDTTWPQFVAIQRGLCLWRNNWSQFVAIQLALVCGDTSWSQCFAKQFGPSLWRYIMTLVPGDNI